MSCAEGLDAVYSPLRVQTPLESFIPAEQDLVAVEEATGESVLPEGG